MHPENERGFLPIQNPKIYPDFKNRPFEELSEILTSTKVESGLMIGR